MPRGTATSRRGGGTRAGQSGRGSCPRRRPPRRRGGTPGEPAHRDVSGGLRPRQRAPNTLGRRRAGRARRRPPRRARRAGRRARTAGTLATRMATDRPRDRSPAHARPRGTAPRAGHLGLHPVRQRTAGGETAPRPPTARWRSCLLRTDGTARPTPATGAADEQSAHNTTAARRRQRRRRATPTERTRDGRARPNGPAIRPGGPDPPPTAPPPIAQSRTRGGPLCDPRRTGADGRAGIGDYAAPDRAY